MKKYLLAAVLGLALTFCGAAAAEEYISCQEPGHRGRKCTEAEHPELYEKR